MILSSHMLEFTSKYKSGEFNQVFLYIYTKSLNYLQAFEDLRKELLFTVVFSSARKMNLKVKWIFWINSHANRRK